MLELELALQRMLPRLRSVGLETISVREAFGRILARDVLSPLALPPFDNSAMDGYAVRASDVNAASAEAPVFLKVVGAVAAGDQPSRSVSQGECIRIFTGSFMPDGADAVVMQEDTFLDPKRSGEVAITDAVKPWENVRFCGEDVKLGSLLARKGERLTAPKLCLLSACGIAEVDVACRPVVGILPTGTELLSPGENATPGRIYESNSVGLAAIARQAGALVKVYPIVQDTLEQTKIALRQALSECDVLLTSGGVSVGEYDFVKSAWEELGGSLDFWKVAIKPGKPFVFGTAGDKYLFGLPGNPVSALVTAFLLVRPALLQMQGASDIAPPRHPAVLAERVQNSGDRRHYIRVVVGHDGVAKPAGIQASHGLSGAASANGLLDVPPKSALEAESVVQVIRWD